MAAKHCSPWLASGAYHRKSCPVGTLPVSGAFHTLRIMTFKCRVEIVSVAEASV